MEHAEQKAPPYALAFIFVTVMLDVIGIGIILPVLPELIRELQPGSWASVAVLGGWLGFAYAFMQFVFAPILGNLSDAYGRRPILILGLVFLAFDYVIMAVAPTILWLFVGRILSGAAGASFTTATAYIADVSPPEKRSANFGLIGAAFGIGFVIGPAIGGLLGEYGTRIPFWAAAGFAALNAVFGIFILPESLKLKNRRPFQLARSNPFGTFKHFLKMRYVFLLIVSGMIYELGQQVYPAIWPFYGSEMFDWTPGDIGLSLTVFGILIFISEGFLLRIALARFSEHIVILGSAFLGVFTLISMGLAQAEWLIWMLLVPSSLSGFASSALQGLAANKVGDDEQGALTGAVMSGAAMVAFITPPIMTGLFAVFSNTGDDTWPYLPGAPFILAALCLMAALIPYRMAKSIS